MSAELSLITELSSRPINILRIKNLCLDNPGLVSSSGLRVRVWSILLGLKSDCDECELDTSDDSVGTPESTCDEQHVLEADVRRTRADMEEFRESSWRKALQDILQHFCLMHDVSYKQGLNEVLAPFVWLLPPPIGSRKPYIMFETFLFRYLERYFLVDDSMFLFKSFRYFHLLLLFHDPQLAEHLHQQGFVPELYAPAWLLTLYSRALPLTHVVRLWDSFLAVDDPSFTFFIGMRLLCHKRDDLLVSQADRIPEIISSLHFSSEQEIDIVLQEALSQYRSTPTSLRRHLRLCCVSTAELAPSASAQRERMQQPNNVISTNSRAGGDGSDAADDAAMAAQSVGSCVTLTPREVVTILEQRDIEQLGLSLHTSKVRSVVIDVRTLAEAKETGGGCMIGALSLDPEFIDEENSAFALWMQHLDSSKGSDIVLLDMPVAKASGVSLWKRLLFGEGDGHDYSNLIRYSLNDVTRTTKFAWSQRDRSSPFSEVEAEAVEQDQASPAVKLARLLQRDSFARVSVVQGGYPAIVEHLLLTRGTVEPLIDGYNEQKWVNFLHSSGRIKERTKEDIPCQDQNDASVSDDGENENDEVSIKQQLEQVSQESWLELSLRVAERLGHSNVASAILSRLVHKGADIAPQAGTENATL